MQRTKIDIIRDILKLCVEQPGIMQWSIMQKVGLNSRYWYEYMTRMLEYGHVERTEPHFVMDNERAVAIGYRTTPKGMLMLDTIEKMRAILD